MRKNRFCTFTLISALVIAALPVTLAAAGTGDPASASSPSLPVQQDMTLTITPGTTASYDPSGSSYTAYRVMSFTRQEGGNWVWDMANGFTYPLQGESFSPDAFGSYSAAKLQNLAAQLALQVTDSMTDKLPQKELSDGSCSWTTDKAGIYLVVETATRAGNFPSAPFLVALPYTNASTQNSWEYSLTVQPKGSTIGLEKVIHEAKGSYLNTVTYEGDKDTVASGDTVQYLITTRIPEYTSVYFADNHSPTFQLVDTMAKGLTLTQSSVSLDSGGQTLTPDTDYTSEVVIDEDTGVTTLTLDLAGDWLSDSTHHNQELVLSYSVVVNDDVSLTSDGNENVVTLHYSYDPLDPEETNEVEDSAKVYSFGIEIEKFDGDTGNARTKLSGAQFALFKETAKGCTPAQALSQEPYRSVGVTDQNGILDFRGLDAGTYYLKEVKAPDGYSLLMNPVKVEIIPASAERADGEEGEEGPEVVTSGSFTAKVNGTEVSESDTEGVSRILIAQDREGTVVVAAANHVGFSLPMTGGSGIVLILVISMTGLAAVTVLYARGGRGKKKNCS